LITARGAADQSAIDERHNIAYEFAAAAHACRSRTQIYVFVGLLLVNCWTGRLGCNIEVRLYAQILAVYGATQPTCSWVL